MPDKIATELQRLKDHHPEKYDEAHKKAELKWKEELKSLPYYKRTMIGDASEIALMKFF